MAATEYTYPEYLISQSTHTCLTVIRGTGVDDAVIGLAKCTGGVKQQWFPQNGQWQWGGNRFLCLSKDAKTGELCLVQCNSSLRPWIHDKDDRMVLGSEALDVPWQKPRTKVLCYPKHHGVNQKWWTLSQLNACLGDNYLSGEHCITPSALEICRKELDRTSSEKIKGLKTQKECNCHVGRDFTMLSHTGEVISYETLGVALEYLINQSTLTCLTVLNGNCPGTTTIGLSPFAGDMTQQWIVKGKHWLWAANTSYCLAPDWKCGTLKLEEVDISKANWNFDDQGLMETESRVLDVPWEKPRTRVIVYPKHGGPNQKWWRLTSVQSTLQKSPTTRASFPEALVKMAEKLPIQNSFCDHQCQCQPLSSAVEGQYETSEEPEYLISQSAHTCLTVLSGTCPDDAVIGLAPYTGDVKQQWFVKGKVWQWGGNHLYSLSPDFSKGNLRLILTDEVNTSWTLDKTGVFTTGSCALDVPWEGERTKVILYPKHGGINQKWWVMSSLKSVVGRKMYPFSAGDRNTYQQEVARGLVNRLCPLSESIPHPRDVVHYPGTVSETTPKVDLSCTLNVGTVRQATNLRMTVPEDWQATNMYVVAGDIFTVVLPDSLTEKQAEQITVRVGAHRDSLDPLSPNIKNGNFKRMPVVSEEFDVNPGVNQLRSQYGGNLIFIYEGEESFRVTAKVKNIVETPYYILGKTSNADWEKMKDLDAPFCILESDRNVLVVPTKEAKSVLDLNDLLLRYDEVIMRLEDLAGFTDDDPPPQGKQWLVDDIQITAGSAHAGFPAMFDHQYYSLTSPETPHDWVTWHELGHNYQQASFWSYAYGSETTVNLFSLYIEEKLKSDDRLKREGRYLPTIEAVDKGLTFEFADCWQKLVFLMEIKHAFPEHGWDTYRHLNRTVRALSDKEAEVLSSSVQKQYDYVYSTLSHYIGVDLSPHYKRWGLRISHEALEKVESLGLPKCPHSLSGNCKSDQCIVA